MTARRPRRLTAERVRELLDCDPSTGALRWKERPGNPSFNAQWAGRLAGKLDPSNGYLRLVIDGRHYYVHRIVWLHTRGWLPKQDLDHRDGNKTRCAIANLRPASKSANNRNRQSSTKQHAAPRGSWFNPRTRQFQAYIETSEAGARQRIFLGSFATRQRLNGPIERRRRMCTGNLPTSTIRPKEPQHERASQPGCPLG
jgi:hypothetical protein